MREVMLMKHETDQDRMMSISNGNENCGSKEDDVTKEINGILRKAVNSESAPNQLYQRIMDMIRTKGSGDIS
jgi:hypothetical protein